MPLSASRCRCRRRRAHGRRLHAVPGTVGRLRRGGHARTRRRRSQHAERDAQPDVHWRRLLLLQVTGGSERFIRAQGETARVCHAAAASSDRSSSRSCRRRRRTGSTAWSLCRRTTSRWGKELSSARCLHPPLILPPSFQRRASSRCASSSAAPTRRSPRTCSCASASTAVPQARRHLSLSSLALQSLPPSRSPTSSSGRSARETSSR